jgi:hypothetical protein
MATVMGGNIGKVRSPLFAGLMGLVVGLIGVYFNWVFWIHALAAKADQSVWAFNPLELIGILYVLAQEGVWSLKSYTPTGAALYTVWAIETVVLLGAPTWLAFNDVRESPFCEKCETWADEVYEDLILPQCHDHTQLRRELEAGHLDALEKLESAGGDVFTAVALHACPTCKLVGYLTVENMMVTTNKKGEQKTQKKPIVPLLLLNATTLPAAMQLPERVMNRQAAAAEATEPA